MKFFPLFRFAELLVLACLSFCGTHLLAAEKIFEVEGVPMQLEEVSAETEVFYSGMRFNRIGNVWNVEVVVRNKGANPLVRPLVLQVTSLTGSPGIQDGKAAAEGGLPYFELPGEAGEALLPGQSTTPLTLSLIRGTTEPKMTVAIYSAVIPVLGGGLVQTLDGDGLTLGDVAIEEISNAESRLLESDKDLGISAVGNGMGEYQWRFTRDGYFPVWRRGSVDAENLLHVPAPRLVKKKARSQAVSALDGGLVADDSGSIQIQLEPGAVALNTFASVTALNSQNLPSFLPYGWSPLQAFWFEISGRLERAAAVRIMLWANPGQKSMAWVRLNESTGEWETIATLQGAPDGFVTGAITQQGAYAVVVADEGTYAPPASMVGSPLGGATVPILALSGLRASGKVFPSSRPASVEPELVTGIAEVIITNLNGAIPSGLVLPGEVSEIYKLRSGEERRLPRYRTHTVFYQSPGDADPSTASSRFPVRPKLLLGPDQIEEGLVQIDILEGVDFDGAVIGSRGGQITRDGIRLLVGAGALERNVPVEIESEDHHSLQHLNNDEVEITRGFRLTISDVASEGRIALEVGGLEAHASYVLAKILNRGGLFGLEPVERFQTDESGKLESAELESGLGGIRGPGQYLLVRLKVPHGLVLGKTRNASGQEQGGMPVQVEGQPWLTFSDPTAQYRIIAPLGAAELTIVDLTNDDQGSVNLEVLEESTAELSTGQTGPFVRSITPEAGATAVPRVSAIKFEFSEALNAATVSADAIEVIGGTNGPVEFTINLNLLGTVLTLLPDAQLPADSEIVVRLAATIQDRSGFSLEGMREFRFTTETANLGRIAGQVVIYEPVDGRAAITGTSGVAEPDGIVILVNENTGYTATVIAKADGSFTNSIRADVDDFFECSCGEPQWHPDSNSRKPPAFRRWKRWII